MIKYFLVILFVFGLAASVHCETLGQGIVFFTCSKKGNMTPSRRSYITLKNGSLFSVYTGVENISKSIGSRGYGCYIKVYEKNGLIHNLKVWDLKRKTVLKNGYERISFFRSTPGGVKFKIEEINFIKSKGIKYCKGRVTVSIFK